MSFIMNHAKPSRQKQDQQILANATAFISAGRYLEAVALVSPWVEKRPQDFHALFLMGSALLGMRQAQKALIFLLRAEKIDPNNSRLLNNIGSAYNSLMETSKAVDYYKKALVLDPKFAQAHYNLGNALMGQANWMEAIGCFSNAIEHKNDYTEAYGNLSLCLCRVNAFNDAVQVCDTYLNQFGENPKIIINKCRAIYDKGLKANAIQTLETYIQEFPASYELHTVLADFCMANKQYSKAIFHYTESIKVNPKEFANYNNLGILYMETGQHDLAIEAYLKSSELNPQSPIPFQNIAAIYNQRKDYESSLRYLEQARELESGAAYIQGMIAHAKIYTCHWSGLEAHIAALTTAIPQHDKLSNPFPPVAYIDDQQLLTKIASDWVKNKCPISHFLPPFENKSPAPGQRIKLGYFSADLHSHATALLMAGLFEAHDRSQFELVGFSFGPDADDALTRRIRSAFDRFIDVRAMSDRAIAALARELKIDIAIDLKGFTQDSRTGIFAERAAPIQMNYLGFPGSMGASYIDYIVADNYIIPEELSINYTEQVLRLPCCYQPNDNLRVIASTPQSRAAHGLPDQAIVLCSFNNNFKITPYVFDIWMRLLTQFPKAVLWLLRDTPTAESNLRTEARARGVDPERLIFAKRVKPEEHLARHVCADLFLDTYPCNAHTTASDALYAGLPLVTCSGNSFASRVAGSLLTTIGLPELITTNLNDYEQKIVGLISDPSQLADVKSRLQTNKTTSPLFDTHRYTKDWERLLLDVYQHSKTRGIKKTPVNRPGF
jgi:predicted O-linked N-acetylglucosamine transferase (SPINDLY family)